MRKKGKFTFSPYAERLLARLVWQKQPLLRPAKMELHMLPDPKFVVRRVPNPTKLSKEDFR